MKLFKRERKRSTDEAWVPQPLLGDSTGSPHYAKSTAYMGGPDSGALPWDAPGDREHDPRANPPEEGDEESPA